MLDGYKVGEGRVEQTEVFLHSAYETLDIGSDDALSVSPDHTPETSCFNGDVNWVEIDLDEAAGDYDHFINEDRRCRLS